MPENRPELSDAELEQALIDLGANMPSPRTRDLTDAVLQRVAAGEPPPDQPPSEPFASAQGPLGLALLALVLLAVGIVSLWPEVRTALVGRPGSPAATTAGQKVVVYGGDLTEAERQELARLFEADEAATGDTVTREELGGALGEAGLPFAPTDKAISSAALTCVENGQGLQVGTERITRIAAAAYLSALLTAGVGDGSVIIAAPSANPVTGETALVGVLTAFPRCQGGQQPEPARVRLAYEQLRATAALAGDTEDLSEAAAVMLKAAHAVISGQARDDASIGAALDAAAGQGLAMSARQRSDLIALLSKLGELDHGAYANGYQIEQIASNEAKLVPAGSEPAAKR